MTTRRRRAAQRKIKRERRRIQRYKRRILQQEIDGVMTGHDYTNRKGQIEYRVYGLSVSTQESHRVRTTRQKYNTSSKHFDWVSLA